LIHRGAASPHPAIFWQERHRRFFAREEMNPFQTSPMTFGCSMLSGTAHGKYTAARKKGLLAGLRRVERRVAVGGTDKKAVETLYQ
jgi:hypothetical protein